jgi:hypothetical protein
MAFLRGCCEPEMLVLMRALDMAWDEVEFALASNDVDSECLRTIMAVSIMAGLRNGEHDLERLKELALEAIAKVY